MFDLRENLYLVTAMLHNNNITGRLNGLQELQVNFGQIITVYKVDPSPVHSI